MHDSGKKPRREVFSARRSDLARLKSFVEAFCTEQGVPRERCLRLNVVLEELFVNTIKHGRRGDGEAPVWVSLGADGDQLGVVYEDAAPAFNPYAWLAAESPTPLKPGGLGVLLTRELSATRDYAYIFGRNRIRLRV